MGYVARDGSGDGKANYFPRVASVVLDHVADANARLSIDPTGKVAGYQVIQDSDGLTYEFLGGGVDADAGLWVTITGTGDWAGPYKVNSDRYDRIPDDVRINELVPSMGNWRMENTYHINTPSTFPWQDTWIADLGTGESPYPIVARNPIASEANWSHP